MTTIVDVCRLAGVSKTTVSRVLNNTGQVSASTRERVLGAIDRLGWRPNALAQANANQRSNMIGLIISYFDSVYFGRLMHEAAETVGAASKFLIVTDGHNDPARELEAVDLLVDRRCDAIVLYSRFVPDEKLLQLVRELPVPLMVMNRSVPGRPERGAVFAQRAAAHAAVTHLLENGHRRIACIASRTHTRTAKERLRGYEQALAEFGVAPDRALIVAVEDSDIPAGYAACQELLGRGQPFSAVFCLTDRTAEGTYRALAEAGIRVPHEVSVFGFDDDPIAAYLLPALSTVRVPIREMTRAVFEQAIRLTAGQPVAPLATFPCALVLRELVAPLTPRQRQTSRRGGSTRQWPAHERPAPRSRRPRPTAADDR